MLHGINLDLRLTGHQSNLQTIQTLVTPRSTLPIHDCSHGIIAGVRDRK